MIDKYLVSAAVHLPMWQWIEDEGIDVLKVLEGTGLEEGQVRDPQCMLSTAQNVRILHNMLTLRKDRALGLDIGRRARLAGVGVLGLMMLCAPTIRKAIEVGIEFAPIGGALGKLTMREEKDTAIIGFHAPPLGALLRPYLTEDMFAAIYSYLSELTGAPPLSGEFEPAPVYARKIKFAYPEPACAEQYRGFFQCPLEFNAPENELHFDAEFIDQRPVLSNALAFDQCKELCMRLATEMKEEAPLIQEARQCVARDPGKYSNLPALAQKLGVPPRTLQRHLAKAGMSFSAMQADVRNALAQDLLRNPALTIEEIAAAIGYGEPGNFRRAFRSWTGVTPSEYRRALKNRA